MFPARNSDPETSKEAAKAIMPKRPTLQAVAVDYVNRHPGCTQLELFMMYYQKDNPSCFDHRRLGRRLVEVLRKNKVRLGADRPCRISGITAQTYYPV